MGLGHSGQLRRAGTRERRAGPWALRRAERRRDEFCFLFEIYKAVVEMQKLIISLPLPLADQWPEDK